ncbi:TBC1 domain family member 23-like [Chelonus insularis]|uniref:TBC1 domain family member 23-like n=1 Tax=Chelonus insularis TaxID=460826 RepID=UPI00158C0ED3|nr:TBC1 domain family member 23-like [Chelonus insularis]
MAEVLNRSLFSAEDIEYRFCDPEHLNLQSERQLTSISTDQLSKIAPWRRFLEETTTTDDIESDNLFDLPEQSAIDEDCQMLIDEVEIPEERKEQMLLAVRTVITVYSKSEKETYKSGNGWIYLLGQIISTTDSTLDIFIIFKKIRDTYVPTPRTHGFILKLLLRYHDPSFYSWINDHDISLDQCTESWFNSLFAQNCTKQVCNLIWEAFVNHQDSFRIFFIALSIILLQKSNLEKMAINAKEKIKDTIRLFPNFINTQDLIDVLENTKKFDLNTPPFFREAFGSFMFGDDRESTPKWLPLLLPLSVTSMLENLRDVRVPTIVSDYFIVDCRPSNQYAGGHFSFKYKYHLDCNSLIKLSSGTYAINDIQLLIERIEAAQNVSQNKEIHICLMGSNLVTNDKCVHTLALKLLKKNIKYVSMLYGGYEIIHNTLKKQKEFDKYVIDHNERKCIVCNPMRKKFTTQIKKKFMKSKEKLLTCVNLMDGNCEDNSKDIEYIFTEDNKIVAAKEPVGRTRSTVSIESDIHGVGNPSISNRSNLSTDNDSSQLHIQFKIVLKDEWLTLPNVMEFKCKEITSDGETLPSLLLVTDTHLVHLRLIKDFEDNAYLIVNCHLFYIERIRGSTSNKNMMIISFDTTHDNRSTPEKHLVPYEEIKYRMKEKEKFTQVINAKFKTLQG